MNGFYIQSAQLRGYKLCAALSAIGLALFGQVKSRLCLLPTARFMPSQAGIATILQFVFHPKADRG